MRFTAGNFQLAFSCKDVQWLNNGKTLKKSIYPHRHTFWEIRQAKRIIINIASVCICAVVAVFLLPKIHEIRLWKNFFQKTGQNRVRSSKLNDYLNRGVFIKPLCWQEKTTQYVKTEGNANMREKQKRRRCLFLPADCRKRIGRSRMRHFVRAWHIRRRPHWRGHPRRPGDRGDIVLSFGPGDGRSGTQHPRDFAKSCPGFCKKRGLLLLKGKTGCQLPTT